MSKMTAQPQKSSPQSEQSQAPTMGGQDEQSESAMGNAGRQEELGIESEGQGGSPKQRFDELLGDSEADPCDVADAFAMLTPEQRLNAYLKQGDALQAATKGDAIADTIVQSSLGAAAATQGDDVVLSALRDEAVKSSIDGIMDGVFKMAEETIRDAVEAAFECAESGQEPEHTIEHVERQTLAAVVSVSPMLAAAVGGEALTDQCVEVRSPRFDLEISHWNVQAGAVVSTLELSTSGQTDFEVSDTLGGGNVAYIDTRMTGPSGTVSHLPGGVLMGLDSNFDYGFSF